MAKIVEKKQLSDEVFLMRVYAPLIAEERKAGQFVILQVNLDYGERIPLTIADANTEDGTITIVFQTVGKTTHLLADLNVGDDIPVLVGPLGNPTHIEHFGTVVGVGGGVGIAPLYPIAKALKEAGNRLIIILGAREKKLLLFEEQMKPLADELIICTDDGSYGRKGFVTEPLKEVCARVPHPDLVVAIGPAIMMKNCTEITRPLGIKTIVSLNTIMIDGTGMCGSCRITAGNKTKFVCVDGPEFDGHQVDFDNLLKRLAIYKKEETLAHEQYHKCKLAEIVAEKKT
jgi:ferredoxin--NADP+ reductase